MIFTCMSALLEVNRRFSAKTDNSECRAVRDTTSRCVHHTRFQISVDYVELVHVLYSTADLEHQTSSFPFREGAALHNVIK